MAIATGNASGSFERGGPFDNFGCAVTSPPRHPEPDPPRSPPDQHGHATGNTYILASGRAPLDNGGHDAHMDVR